MKCIVHFGMFKTGSSSIQKTLFDARSDLENFDYPNFGQGVAHNSMLVNAFRNKRGPHINKLEESKWNSKKTKSLQTLASYLINSQLTGNKAVILSSEFISSFKSEELKSFYSFLKKFCNEVIAVGYVRAPKGYIESSFQQKIKGWGQWHCLNLESEYPNYQERFEVFDQIFGIENVHFWKFDPSSFSGSCVVLDFCQRLNIKIDPDQVVRVNEGLSKDAVSLLYAFRKFRKYDNARRKHQAKNNKFIGLMSQLKGSKLLFSAQLIGPILEANQNDIEWMEQRLGESLYEDISRDDHIAINNEDDLFRFSKKSFTWLSTQLGMELLPPDSEKAPKVAQLVNTLCKQTTGLTTKPNIISNKKIYKLALKTIVSDIKLQEPELNKVPDKIVSKLLSETFKLINEKIESNEKGSIDFDGLCQFKINLIKNIAEKQSITKKRIIFNQMNVS